MDISRLIAQAAAARNHAYAPYSHFKVGCALLGQSGRVYTGCNVENSAYSATNCAERTAFFHAVASGEQHFTAICIIGGYENTTDSLMDFCPPCGICRQVMAEFCDFDTFQVILAKPDGAYRIYPLSSLLPVAFSGKQLSSDVQEDKRL